MLKKIKQLRKGSDKTRVFINTVFVTFETVFDKSVFFVINVIIARFLSLENFGEYTTALGYATFFSTFCDIGINGSLVRSLNINKEHKNEHVTNALLIKTSLVIIVYAAMSLSLYFSNYNRVTINLILIFGLVRIGNEYLKVFYAYYNANEKFLFPSVSNSLFAVSFLLATVAVVVVNGNYFHIAFSRLAIILVFIAVLAFLVLRKVRLVFNRNAMKTFLPQMFYFGMSSIYANAYQRLNILILSFIHGTLLTGYFNNAYMFFTSLFFIPSNLSKVLVPNLYKTSFQENKSKFQFAFDVYTKILVIISFFIAMMIFLYAREIITIVYGERYFPAVKILRIIALAIPALFNVSKMMMTALDRQKDRIRYESYALVLNIIANIILIYYFKAEGAAYATVATYYALNFMYNRFLHGQGYISFAKQFVIIGKTILAVAVCGISHYLWLSRFHFMISAFSVTVIFAALVLVLLINRKDIKLMKEIFGIKK